MKGVDITTIKELSESIKVITNEVENAYLTLVENVSAPNRAKLEGALIAINAKADEALYEIRSKSRMKKPLPKRVGEKAQRPSV